MHDGHIVTETVQRRDPGHVVRQCKEPKRARDSQWYHDKALLMQAPYNRPLSLTTTNLFKANHEDTYDSDVDEGPHASAAFMANLSSTGGTNGSSSSHINEVQISDDSFFSNVSYPLAQEMQQEEHLNSKFDSVLNDSMITYDEYQNDFGVEAIPTVVSADEANKQSMIAVLQRMHTEIDGYVMVNDEHKLVNATLTAELERCKIKMQALECNKVKHDLNMAIVKRNKQNAELEEENVMLKSTLKSKVVSIENLQQESKQVLSEKKTIEDKYLEEIVVLTNANKVATNVLKEKIAAQKAKIAILNAKIVGNKTSGTTKPANPKETPKPSPRFTKKPVAPLLKKPNVNVPLSTGIKSAIEASKPASKSNAWIYRKLPAKSAKGEKVEEDIRNLNKNNRVDSHVKCSIFVKNLNAVCGAFHECLIYSNHDNCLVYSVKSVNRKQPKAKNTMRTTKKVWRPKVVTSVKPMWKPTGHHFTLYDSYPLTRILEPTVEPIELSSGVSFTTKIPMLSKFVAVTLGMESWFQRNPCYV
nr:hypothetical protein [Tanacetum cinerariifolium]